MNHISSIKFLKIFLGSFLIILLSYNFYVANTLKYEADGDALNFIELGLSLAKMHKYGQLNFSEGQVITAFKKNNVADGESSFGGYRTWRPPVWPFLIAGIFLIFGYNLTYILIFKFLLHLIGLFVFYKTLKLFKLQEVLILIGTFLYGISPAWQLYSRVFLSEPITLFFITLYIYFLIKFYHEKVNWWPQSLIAGILILCHPYYIFLPYSIWLVLVVKKQMNLKFLMLSVILTTTIISTWVIRNIIVLETTNLILTTSSGAVIAKGWNSEVPDNHTNTQGDLADETLVLEGYQYNRDRVYNEIEKMSLYNDATLDFIYSNPELILPIIGKKIMSALNPFPETPKPGILETGRWLFQFLALLSLIYILFFSQNTLLQTFAYGLILSTVTITILTYSGFRFRMPQVGLEMLFIIFVIDNILKKINNKTTEN